MHHLPNQRVKFDRDYNNRLKSAKGGEDKDDVVAYSAHVPSFADTWGWVMVGLGTNPFLFQCRGDRQGGLTKELMVSCFFRMAPYSSPPPP
ncbi:hypothetical protein OIU76_019654 [Salix suchowensis]|nr:hypothetical protein OIU76_019654 [Salix suchowensis]